MGFFSFQCRGCKKSIRSPHSYNEGEEWMNKAVVLLDDDTRIVGDYDGYGRINDNDIEQCDEGDWWHHKCWVTAGKPAFFARAEPASDQGFFDNLRDDEEEEDE